MEHTLTGRYRRWFEYERDSHAKVLRALGAVPEALRAAPQYRKAVALLAHVAAARELWLFRLGAIAEGPSDLGGEGRSLHEVSEDLEAIETAWAGYLDRLDDARLVEPLRYRSLEGEWYRTAVVDILAQLFGHSAYHRGQIALLLRELDQAPPITDFVYWAREEIPAPEPAHGTPRPS